MEVGDGSHSTLSIAETEMQQLRLNPVDLPGSNALPSYLESLARTAQHGGDVVPELASLARHFEFDSFTFWAATRSTTFVEGRLYEVSTLQPAWALRYDGMGYVEVDPKIRAVLAQTLPFVWDQRTWRGRNSSIDKFLDDAAGFGIGSGVCIPIHDASFGIVRFDFDSTKREIDDARRDEIRDAFGRLSVAGRFLHDLFVVAVRHNALRSRLIGVPLNERERNCLALAARGLTLHEIANDLNIDVQAANTHFDSIRAKLGCLNSNEAVAYLFKSGLAPP